MNTKVSVSDEERSLLKLRDSMTDQQRSDMAEIIGNELKRREALKGTIGMKSSVKSSRLSGELGTSDLKDVYENSDKNIQQLRVKKLESRLQEAKREATRFGIKPQSRLTSTNINFLAAYASKAPVIFLTLAIIALAGVKSMNSITTTDTKKSIKKNVNDNLPAENNTSRASLNLEKKEDVFKEIGTDSELKSHNELVSAPDLSVKLPMTENERAILMQLDQRRVELERRRMVLDQKEKDLITQSKLVSEKVTELKSLTNKLAALRAEKDSKYEARLDQLASVYGAMAPNEASSLIAKLDEEVALGLLERMPEKRMAQILGVMDQARAIELTKSLTNRKSL